jgi:hypothetical protein
VEIDPKARLVVDAVAESDANRRDHRGWIVWLSVAMLSVLALWATQVEVLPGGLRFALAILGGIGGVLFLAFLSTKTFGWFTHNRLE